MAVVKWQSICIFCGKGGPCTSRSDSSGRPTSPPSSIGGKCPSSPDGKHKPSWELV